MNKNFSGLLNYLYKNRSMKKVVCSITNQILNQDECVKGDTLREYLLVFIQKEYPDFNMESYISIDELNKFRRKYMAELSKNEIHNFNELKIDAENAISEKNLVLMRKDTKVTKDLTTGQKVADSVAKFGGSWTFIFIFFSFLFGWMGINIFLFAGHPYDPYPFILLNLILSCLAAIQAPIIMMSQNRKEEKDRLRGEEDYKTDLKAEIEIGLLNKKMDYLIENQSRRLVEMHEIQTDYLNQILNKVKPIKKPRKKKE